jgi:hypothetical protein
MDAIRLLDRQHDEVEALFARVDKAATAAARQKLFEEIGDALAIHAAIEEKIFYPAVYASGTNEILLEAVEEHLAAKRVIADLIGLPSTDEHYIAKLGVLREEILYHVRQERKELFPRARKLLDKAQLEALGEQMEALTAELKTGAQAPRFKVPAETRRAANLR